MFQDLKKRALSIAALTVFSASPALADTALIDINNDAFSFEYDVTNLSEQLNFSAGVLHHKDDGQLYSIGANVEGPAIQNSEFYGSLGLKAYYADLDSGVKGSAIGIGGFLNYSIYEVEGLSVQVDAYYAPSVLSFSDIDNLIDFSAKVLYRVIENGSVYLGYRKANIDIEDAGDDDLDKGFHVGLAISF